MCSCQALLKQMNLFSSTRTDLGFFWGGAVLLNKAKHLAVCHFSTLLYTSHLWRWVFFRKTDWHISRLFSAHCTTNNLCAFIHYPALCTCYRGKTTPKHCSAFLKAVILLFYFPNRQKRTCLIDRRMWGYT